VTLATMPPRQSIIQRQAAAKINLTLHVTGKRADGYHLLDSLIVFAGVGDQIQVAPADNLSLELDGPFCEELADAGSEDDNLVMRAARMLASRRENVATAASCNGAHIRLTKNLPIAAGVGGGSADAAAALDAVSELWGMSLPQSELMALGLELGADVPACIAGVPVHVSGIGDQIEPAVDLPVFHLVLVNPRVLLSTARVFGTLRPETFVAAPPPCPPVADLEQLVAEIKQRRNDLEAPALVLVPEIAEVLKTLADQTGCRMSRMSGSGATCFGIFADEISALGAVSSLAKSNPEWWAVSGPVLGSGI
jgi:4-diphosphocytidyl-2-C-methyl-D-erythritol kinase